MEYLIGVRCIMCHQIGSRMNDLWSGVFALREVVERVRGRPLIILVSFGLKCNQYSL